MGSRGIAASGASSAHTDVAAQQASISATNGVTLNARQDIDNVGGKLAATNGDLTLNAGGNVNVQAQELSTVQDANNSTTTHVKSALSAGGNVNINAGGDATITATDVNSGKNTQITAGGGVTLGAAQDETKSYSSHKSCILWGLSCSSSSTASDNVIEVVTTINAGGWVQAEAKTKDLLGTATNVNAQGDINLLADKGNASVVAGQNISWSHSTSGSSILWGLIGSSHSSTDSRPPWPPRSISAMGNEHVTVQARLRAQGLGRQAGGSIFVTAQNIDLIAVQNTTYHSQTDEKWGIFAAAGAGNGTASVTLAWQDSKTTTSDVQTSSQGASLEAGGNLTINAGGTLNVTGSTATAAGDVNIHAAQVNLAAAQDTDVKQTTTTTDSYGILPAMNNGIGIGIGANLVTDKNGSTTVSSIGALIGSTGGSVFINAGTSVNAQGSIVESLAGNVTVTAPTIEMAAGVNTSTSYAYHSATFIGINISFTAGANNPLGQVQTGATYLNAADKTKDPQAKLLYEAAAGIQAAQGALNVYKAMSAPGGLTGAMSSFDIKFGVGMSVSTQESGATVQQASGGQILAAGNLGLYATAGDLKLTGANVSAYNVTLSAQRDLVIQSLALTDTSYSKSSSWSAFAGLDANVSYGADGFSAKWGINVSASDTTTQSKSIAVNHAQTTVSGANWVTLASGRDTNLYGAEVSGGGITAQVARNLNIVSDQDTETQTASLTSWSFSATIGLYGSPSSLSASYAKGDAYGNYASVTTTSGLFAGSSGYAVTVGGTTTLTAAALGSTASASQNSLTTGALVTQNLTNSMNWKASYWGFSFSASNRRHGRGAAGAQPEADRQFLRPRAGHHRAGRRHHPERGAAKVAYRQDAGPDRRRAQPLRHGPEQGRQHAPRRIAANAAKPGGSQQRSNGGVSLHSQARGRRLQHAEGVRRSDRRDAGTQGAERHHHARGATATRRGTAASLALGRGRRGTHSRARRDARRIGLARRRLLARCGLARGGRGDICGGACSAADQRGAEAPRRRRPRRSANESGSRRISLVNSPSLGSAQPSATWARSRRPASRSIIISRIRT